MTESRLRELLVPFVSEHEGQVGLLPDALYSQLLSYLELLLRWNARTNLTAIRDPEQIVRRHFGESLFTARTLQPYLPEGATLLDVGSGAGFPGIPIQLALPEVSVTLAESQGKKAAFLREVARVLGIPVEVWGDRVEALPVGRRFDVVTLRAVDRMSAALAAAEDRVRIDGLLAELSGADSPVSARLKPFQTPIEIPESDQRVLKLWISS